MKHLKHIVNCAALLIALLSGALANAATTITYYHNDLLGSPVAATDASGHVIWRESYRPYGERLTNDPASTGNDVWYTSRRQDADTGLVYMGARYYDPVEGRFVSRDPVGFDEKNIQSFNRYAYANNNPYRFTDPTGAEGVATLWMDDTAPLVVTAQSFGALAAYVQGSLTGNDNLTNVASQALDENRQQNTNMALMLLSLGRAGVNAAGVSETATVFRSAPDFVVSPNGTVFPVPKGASGPVPVVNEAGAQTGTAFVDGSGGANGQVSTLRMMDPTAPRGASPGYPNGYIKYENAGGQGVDPYSGRTLPNSQSHFPIR